MGENLEKNIFFNLLRSKYSKLYKDASKNCFLILIPQNKTLRNALLDEKFVYSHILKPSPLLISHYLPYKKCSVVDVELDKCQLIVQHINENNLSRINILGEEIAYNDENREFKILIIEDTLVKPKKAKEDDIELINGSGSYQEPFEHPESILYTFYECRQYLSRLEPEVFDRVTEKVAKLLRTYLILPNYLEDAATRFKAIIDWTFKTYLEQIDQPEIDRDILCSAIECYIIGYAFDHIYPVVEAHYKVEDDAFMQKCISLDREQLRPVDLGASSVFSNFRPSDQVHQCLKATFSCNNPLEKIYNLKLILDEINKELSRFIETNSSPFSKTKPQVLSDDLVAIVILVLVRFVPAHSQLRLISQMKFIELFCFYFQSKNEYGYSLVTFEVAVEYIKNHQSNLEKTSDIKKKTTKTSNSKSQKPQVAENSFENDHFRSFSMIERALKDLDNQNLQLSPTKGNRKCNLDDEFSKLSLSMKEPVRNGSVQKPSASNDLNEQNLGEFLTSLQQKSFIFGSGKQT